ncbi:MAG: HD domain-containing protein [Rhodocyclaceae bacterium]|nr:MAG: HD domain-containing protein [Pseudomonadota bacterium]
MNEQHVPVPRAGADIVVEKLPRVFRIQAIERLPFDQKSMRSCAALFHERATLNVEWLSKHCDVRLTVGSLVSIRWSGRPVSCNGAVRIARLVLLEQPEASINLFDTIPTAWVRDRELVQRGRAIWAALPRGFCHMFNAIFWEAGRFHRYVSGPSSLRGHHHAPGGNLRHCIEVAERALGLAAKDTAACVNVLLLAALLHDAGKADEYRLVNRRFELSDRGRLVGHRHTVIEWIAAARARYQVIVPDADYLALMHVLTCAKGAPPWLGMREPQSLDATILQMADRVSAQGELIGRHAPGETGFGRYHPHLGMRPFVVRASG